MSGILFYLAIAACLGVLLILAVGIGGFGSGKATPQFSQKMMRWRIIAQFVALILIMLTIWAARSGG